jgi:hypothetical protein
MTAHRHSKLSGTEGAPATDHREVEWQFDTDELGTPTGGTRVPRGVAFTMGVYAERCSREARDFRAAIPDSKPFRLLTKGILGDRKAFSVPNTGVR